MRHLAARLRAERRGASMAEYGIVITVIAIVLIVFVTGFGRRLTKMFRSASHSLDEGEPMGRSPLELASVSNVPGPGNAPNPPLPLQTLPANEATAAASGLPITPPGHAPANPPARARDDLPAYGGSSLANVDSFDPSTILVDMTQIDQHGDTPSDPIRCARAAYLAAAVLAGPDAVRRLINDLARNIINGTTPGGGRLTNAEALLILARVRDRLDEGTFDHGDLGYLQQMIADYYVNPNTGMTQAQYPQMIGLGNPDTSATAYTTQGGPAFLNSINALTPGQSYIVGVNWNGNGPSHHATTVGRDENGRIYWYDPWPKNGGPPQIVYHDRNPDQFREYLNSEMPVGGFPTRGPFRF